ncbi:MAG: sulfatase [Alphaproteobacteria bacterium]|nr:sulfatase [Alphaproteobacteria bacterium]
MARWIKRVLTAIIVLGAAAFLAKDYVLLHLPGWLAPRTYANRAVEWQQGPQTTELSADRRPPNVVLIVADDLGYNDITLNGGGVAGGAAPTPHIDAIGHEGASFVNGYAGNATCAPSRAALMTGRYPARFGFEFTPTDVRFARTIAGFASTWEHKAIFDEAAAKHAPPPDDKGVPPGERTIAELLHNKGYHTVHLGKWHLGGSEGMRPEQQGFDESLGFIIGAQMFLPENDPQAVNSKQDFDSIDKYLWANLPFSVQYNGGPRFHPDRYMTDYLSEQAVRSIRANRNRPFFMYLAYNAPHTPLQALKEDYDALPQIGDHRLRVYAAMIRALDRGVGRVMAELKSQGLDNNTLVVFTSDNGGAHYIGLPDINLPYRGWKATFFEGGIKVPFLMRWPARVPAGVNLDGAVSHFDIFATAGVAGGGRLPSDRELDGVDLMPYIRGDAAGQPHDALFWRSGGYRSVISKGWKLQTEAITRAEMLFDLGTDPTERHDVAAGQPEKVTALKHLLQWHDAGSVAPAWPALVHAPIAIDRPLGAPPVDGETYIYWSN